MPRHAWFASLFLWSSLFSGLCAAPAQNAPSAWTGEWGSGTATEVRRLTIHDCSAAGCSFAINKRNGMGSVGSASEQQLVFDSPDTAHSSMRGPTSNGACVLSFRRSGETAIAVVAKGVSCSTYYASGNVAFDGTYPLRTHARYAGNDLDGCYTATSPARTAICNSAELAGLEHTLADLDSAYPNSEQRPREDRGAALLKLCDRDADPAGCLRTHSTAEIATLQARRDSYIAGTTERGDPAAGGALARKLAGSYRHTFANGDVSGDHYRTTDTLTLKPVGAASLDFDMELNFFNGHTCSLSGGALYRRDGSFVFDDEAKNQVEGEPLCRLAIVPDAGGVTFRDITDGCKLYCGARGTFNGEGFRFTQRKAGMAKR